MDLGNARLRVVRDQEPFTELRLITTLREGRDVELARIGWVLAPGDRDPDSPERKEIEELGRLLQSAPAMYRVLLSVYDQVELPGDLADAVQAVLHQVMGEES